MSAGQVALVTGAGSADGIGYDRRGEASGRGAACDGELGRSRR